jgi:hypothetical protein
MNLIIEISNSSVVSLMLIVLIIAIVFVWKKMK